MQLKLLTHAVAKVVIFILVSMIGTASAEAQKEDRSFHELIERQTRERLQSSPQQLTSLGINPNPNDDSYRGNLDDTSLEAYEAMKANIVRWRQEILAWDRASLVGQEALTYEIALRQYDGALERAQFPYAIDLARRSTFAIDHMYGPQTSLPRFMESQHRISDERSALHFVERLTKFGAAFDGALRRLRMQREGGVLPPRFVIQNVLDDARIFIAPPPAENALVLHLKGELGNIDSIDTSIAAAITDAAVEAMTKHVYPAFERLIATYAVLQPQAENVGVWALPDGVAYYETMLRVETTSNVSADEVHQIGLAEVTRIEAEMDRILRKNGLSVGGVGARIADLARDPEHLFSNDDKGRASLIGYLEALLADMHERQKAYFSVLPRAHVVVQRVPEFAEANQTIAYYGAGSLDGSRPGTYYINLRDTHDMPRWSLPSLSYHEAIPGHHVQIMIARELEHLPLYRRSIGVTAFVEGWALYAERLAWEMGAYQNDPLGNLGRLQYEMWRAVRMVVDTGIHVKRWSKERAVDYFMAKTGMSLTDATTEIERYFVTPGSAPAYKLGMLKIQELRNHAEEELGEEFKIHEFHDAILRNGPLPLDLLEKAFRDWLSKKDS